MGKIQGDTEDASVSERMKYTMRRLDPSKEWDLTLFRYDEPARGGSDNAHREFWNEIEALREDVARLTKAIVWALGYTDFRARENGEGAYWWRPELRRRAALTPKQIEAAQAALTQGKGGGNG